MSVASGREGGGAESGAVESRLDELQRWHTAGRFVALSTVVALGGLFGLFGWKTYTDVRSAFTPERTRAAVEATLPQVVPPVGEALKGVVAESLPVYRQLAAERYPEVRDRLAEASLARLQTLPDEAGDVLANALLRTFERTLERVEPEFAALFPSLADEASRSALIVAFHDAIERRNAELASKIETIGVSEAARVRAMLEKLRLPPDEAAPSDTELQKRFVRTMVRLIEAELDAFAGGDAPPATATLDGN
ncbi:MAG: hypothetical protein ACK4PI_00050 [Tepidisphaerales bacterium]